MKSRLTIASFAAAMAMFALPTASQAGFVRDGDDCFGWLRARMDDMFRRTDAVAARVDEPCLFDWLRRDHREAVVVKGHRHVKKSRRMAAPLK